MKIKKLIIDNFKGLRHLEVNFSDRTVIKAKNGVGKTTIADAFYWLFTGKDSKITDNPNVIPIGMTEVNPTVEALVEIDGKSVTVRKMQKYKVKDGKESSTNHYIINEVPMTERDFKAKLTELGLDMDKFLVLSHPDYLLRDNSKKNRDYIRNEILFPMAEAKTDKEIADIEKLSELSELLNDYKINEVEAMQKATLKKITDEVGKDNVVANARIDALVKSKSGVNAEAVNKDLADTKAKLQTNLRRQEEMSVLAEDYKSRIMDLKFELNSIVSKVNDENRQAKADIEAIADKEKALLTSLEREHKDLEFQIKVKNETVITCDSRIDYLKSEIIKTEKEAFNEENTICPTCHQKLPDDEIKAVKDRFETSKANRIKAFENEKAEYVDLKAKTENEILVLKSDMQGKQNDIDITSENCKEIQVALGRVSSIDVNVEEDADYMSLSAEIKSLESKLNGIDTSNIKSVEENLRGQIRQLEASLVNANRDLDIDKQIEDIRAEIKQAEINRANAEKILDQIAQLNKAKNSLLEEGVNKHFSLVKWKLFKVLKNGSYEDDCIPTIDGFEFKKSTNTGRDYLAKIDIADGLQKFYKQNLPVFLDEATELTSNTIHRIKVDYQLIMLKSLEFDELVIEEDI